MIIKDITYAIKRGQPNFGSISAGMTVTIENVDELDSAWDYMKGECESQCNTDPSWINKDDEISKERKAKAQQKLEDIKKDETR